MAECVSDVECSIEGNLSEKELVSENENDEKQRGVKERGTRDTKLKHRRAFRPSSSARYRSSVSLRWKRVDMSPVLTGACELPSALVRYNLVSSGYTE